MDENKESGVHAQREPSEQFDVMQTIDPDYAESFEREKCFLCGASNGHHLSCVTIQRDHIEGHAEGTLACEGEKDAIVQLIHKNVGIRQRINVDLTGVEEAAEAIIAERRFPANTNRDEVARTIDPLAFRPQHTEVADPARKEYWLRRRNVAYYKADQIGSCRSPAASDCEDCPPIGYPTDKTRCEPCPRRSQPENDKEPK